MSLLFESAIGDFELSGTTLCSPATAVLEPVQDNLVPIDGIVEYASYHDRLAHPKKDDWIAIPLHEQDSAELSGAYIAFTDHAVHGEVFVYDDGGEYASIDRELFAKSSLARRVRFWHSDYAPETPPSYFDSPIAEREPPRNPLTEADTDAFFDELESFVRAEMDAQRDANRAKAATSTPKALRRDGFGSIPSLSSLGRPEDGVYRFRIDDEQLNEHRNMHRVVQNEFRIFQGNEVLLHPPSEDHAPDEFPIPATVDSIQGSTVSLAIDWHAVEDRSTVGGFLRQKRRGFGITLLLNPVPYDRFRYTYSTARAGRSTRENRSSRRPANTQLRYGKPRRRRALPDCLRISDPSPFTARRMSPEFTRCSYVDLVLANLKNFSSWKKLYCIRRNQRVWRQQLSTDRSSPSSRRRP